MIQTTVGMPGAGKSLYSTLHAIAILTETDSSICANSALKLPELHAYLAKHHSQKHIDTPKRVRILTEEESRKFWLYRLDSDGKHVDLQDVSKKEEKQGKRVNYDVITEPNRIALEKGLPRPYPGIQYIIDECHVFFDSRAWALTGVGLTYYNSQHRKLDDDVMFLTQFLGLIDTRVKDFSQEFIYLRNHSLEMFLTLFRRPPYFTAKHYNKPPTLLHDFPNETHRFLLDKEVANCYDTSAGVGIKGVGRAESKKKRKGLPFWCIAFPIGVFCYVVFMAPDWLARGVLHTGAGRRGAESLGVVPAGSSPAPAAVDLSVSPSSAVVPSPAAFVDQAAPYPVGYVASNTRITVFMSDGTTRNERDAELTRVERNSVTIDGRKQFFRARPRDPAVIPTSAPSAPPVPQESAPAAVQADEVTRFNTAGEVPGKSTYRL